ncbi:GNAT family N-acetyltransferase [Ramlibacter sp.]|uniref:GNAT family N-acetyltransferase n=1 Tax=Ramlibacter sp. TaxID=1917967 RepID=UPI002CCE6492|nr:GNAT family N-acetyltransferase [Ramlibacter sp.]HWI83646.1 GNAT family N-acetyltransferase [Ramlibacter sp.]
MRADIAPLRDEHFSQLREVLDVVAREGRYLAFLQAPPMEEAFAFYRNILERDCPAVVAVANGRVVGWCDVLPTHGESRAHVGIIGLGLMPEYRGRGIGAALMRAALERAWAKGFTRIELTVRADNVRAKRLYERLGFTLEGTLRHAFRVNGEYFDSLFMGLLRHET